MDRPAVGCCFLIFPLLMLLNCPPYMCHTLNSLGQLHQKWKLRIVLETTFVYCSLNSANPYTFKHLNNGGSIQNDNTSLHYKCEIFCMRNTCPKASQQLYNQNYEACQAFHPHTPPPKKNEMLPYPHKRNWRRLTNISYGSFTGSVRHWKYTF